MPCMSEFWCNSTQLDPFSCYWNVPAKLTMASLQLSIRLYDAFNIKKSFGKMNKQFGSKKQKPECYLCQGSSFPPWSKKPDRSFWPYDTVPVAFQSVRFKGGSALGHIFTRAWWLRSSAGMYKVWVQIAWQHWGGLKLQSPPFLDYWRRSVMSCHEDVYTLCSQQSSILRRWKYLCRGSNSPWNEWKTICMLGNSGFFSGGI